MPSVDRDEDPNGHPAWGEYVQDKATGGLHLVGLLVVVPSGDRVRDVTHFETALAPYFGLPRTLARPR